MTDLNSLLSRPSNSFRAPPVYPSGTYFGTVTKYERGVSAQKKTPFIKYYIKLHTASADIDWSEVEGGEISPIDKDVNMAYYITEDAFYRHTELCEALGLDISEPPVALFGQVVGQEVMVSLMKKMNQKGDNWINEITSLGSAS